MVVVNNSGYSGDKGEGKTLLARVVVVKRCKVVSVVFSRSNQIPPLNVAVYRNAVGTAKTIEPMGIHRARFWQFNPW